MMRPGQALLVPSVSCLLLTCCCFDRLLFWRRPPASEYTDLVAVSQIGFKPADAKRAVLGMNRGVPSPEFRLLDADGRAVFEGRGRRTASSIRHCPLVLAFDDFRAPGTYVVECNGLKSAPFAIADDVWRAAGAERTFDSFFRFQSERPGMDDGRGRSLSDADLDLPMYLLDEEGHEHALDRRFPDASGGWYDATSTDKETVKIAWAAQNLLLAYEANPGLFSLKGSTGIERVLEEAAVGLRYLFKLQEEDGGVLLAVKPYDAWVSNAPPRRILANKGTGVTAKTVAAWATAARVFREKDPELAAECLERARRGWRWVREHPDAYIMDKVYPGYWTGRVSSVLWAAVEMHITTASLDPDEAAGYLETAGRIAQDGRFRDGVWVSGLGPFATSPLATVIEEPVVFALARLYPHAEQALQKKIRKDLTRWFKFWVRTRDPAYGVAREAFKPWFGANGWLMQIGMAALVAGEAVDRADMIRFGQDQVQWVLGLNPFGMSFVVGCGTRYHQYPFHRPVDLTVGGVVPGVIDTNQDGVPENMAPQEWQLDECSVDGGGFFVWDVAMLDKLGRGTDP